MPPKRKQKRKFLAKLVNTAVGSVVIATDDDDGPPDNQTLINTHFALKLPPCTAKSHKVTCPRNPQCYLGFGEKKEGIWAAANELGHDPADDLRSEDVPVGLKNLGATCYMNSLLQCLFMNMDFRKGVYLWDGDLSDEDNAVCYQLQLLFTHLQCGQQKYFSPEVITDLLNIKTSVQQDAQEFYKLFVTYLEERFAKSPNPFVQRLIHDQFVGKYAYVTRCAKCGNESATVSAFYELEIIISKDTLGSCLDNFVAEEQLTGDNQYDCSVCNHLTDATRGIRLQELPNVLNFQLLRFQYDLQTGSKKKLSKNIQFPLRVNMRKYMQPTYASSLPDEYFDYYISGVLSHQGASAYCGHYIAVARDESNGKWWRFNDEQVATMTVKSNVLPFTIDPTNKELYDKNLDSKDAYMLVYSRATPGFKSIPTPPTSTLHEVEATTNAIYANASSYAERKAKVEKLVEEHEEEYDAVMALIRPDPKGRFLWLDADWFGKWVKSHSPGPIENHLLLCHHNLVDPVKLGRLKRVSEKAWTYLHNKYGGGPELTSDMCCVECSSILESQKQSDNQDALQRARILKLLQEQATIADGFWVGPRWLEGYKKKWDESQMGREPCGEITCEHGNLITGRAGRKLIKAEAWRHLRPFYPDGPEYPGLTAECPTCLAYDAEVERRAADRKLIRQRFGTLVTRPAKRKELDTGPYSLVSTLWLSTWREFLEEPRIEEPPPPIDNSNLLCEHGNCLFDPSDQCATSPFEIIKAKEWEQLHAAYCGGPSIEYHVFKKESKNVVSPPVCAECRANRIQQEKLDSLRYVNKKITVQAGYFSTSSQRASRAAARRGPRTAAITVDSSDTVDILKMKILQSLDIAPHEQDVYFNDVLLTDDNQTLAQAGITPDTVLRVKQVDREPEIPRNMTQEEGFAGSALVMSPQRNRSPVASNVSPLSPISVPSTPPSPDEQPMEIEGASNGQAPSFDDDEHEKPSDGSWSCNACTTTNVPSATACIVCETRRGQSIPDAFSSTTTTTATATTSSSSSPATATTWSCNHCTLINKARSKKCAGCDRPRS